jgi:hypothetical protein
LTGIRWTIFVKFPVELSAGTRLSTGGVVSRTVTVKLPLPLFPCASVALQLTVVVAMAMIHA